MRRTKAQLEAQIEAQEVLMREATRALDETRVVLKELEAKIAQPGFLLARFRGVSKATGKRELFDAHVVEEDNSTYFTLLDTHRGIEVFVDPVKQ